METLRTLNRRHPAPAMGFSIGGWDPFGGGIEGFLEGGTINGHAVFSGGLKGLVTNLDAMARGIDVSLLGPDLGGALANVTAALDAPAISVAKWVDAHKAICIAIAAIVGACFLGPIAFAAWEAEVGEAAVDLAIDGEVLGVGLTDVGVDVAVDVGADVVTDVGVDVGAGLVEDTTVAAGIDMTPVAGLDLAPEDIAWINTAGGTFPGEILPSGIEVPWVDPTVVTDITAVAAPDVTATATGADLYTAATVTPDITGAAADAATVPVDTSAFSLQAVSPGLTSVDTASVAADLYGGYPNLYAEQMAEHDATVAAQQAEALGESAGGSAADFGSSALGSSAIAGSSGIGDAMLSSIAKTAGAVATKDILGSILGSGSPQQGSGAGPAGSSVTVPPTSALAAVPSWVWLAAAAGALFLLADS